MKTLTALFDTNSQARDAVAKLESIGIPSSSISVVGHRTRGDAEFDTDRDYVARTDYEGDSNAGEGAGTGAGVGATIGGAGGLLAGLGLMAIPGVGPVVAAGWLAATLAGAVGGAVVGGAAGGLIGALQKGGVSEDDAHTYAEGVRRGGSLVTVQVSDEKVSEADRVLSQYGRADVAGRRKAYTDEGWTRFDETADPYTADQIAKERARYTT